jgi:LysM repeat protein
VADLLAANPQITNANLIQVGQKISIPGGSVTVAKSEPTKAPTPTTKIEPVEPTKTPEPAAITAPPEPTTAATADEIMSAFETARVPGEGDGQSVSAPTPKPTQRSSMLLPGSLVEVSVAGFPPNVPVTVGISQVGKTPFTINESTTDDQGVAKVTVVVPANARRNQMWTVTITTTNTDPKIVATSVPFVVGK